MDTKALEGIGLTKNESKVYLTLIELGSASATQLMRKTGFHRAVIYDLLERLIEKGLCGHVVKGRKKFFEATDPNKLKNILEEKQNELQKILPHLLQLSQFNEHLAVKIYKGEEGVKTIFEDILNEESKEWLSIGSAGETYKLLPYFLSSFHLRRIKLKIKARGLLLDTKDSRKRGEELSKMSFTELKYLPRDFVTPTVMNLFSNKVALYSITKDKIPFIILIENNQIFNSFKEYFEWLWKISKS